MKLLVFTTHRQLRHFVASHNNTFLPKLLSIGEFFDRIIDIDTPLVDEDTRKLLLYEAAKRVSLEKLGLSAQWRGFLSQVDLLYSFLLEMKQEKVELKSLDTNDTYAEYSHHLALLATIQESYYDLLQKHNLTDKLFIQDPPLNQEYLAQFSQIELFVEGYLTKFERELLSKIKTPLTIHFSVTPFNKRLALKMFGIEKEGVYAIQKEPKFKEPLPKIPAIEVAAFSTRVDQVDFVFAKIEEFVQSGIEPQNIAVILPDASFKEYLEAFDELNNLNFAMGEKFIYSNLYRVLEAYYKAHYEKEEHFLQKLDKKSIEILQSIKEWQGLKEAIKALATPKEMDLIQEELFRFERLVVGFVDDLQNLWHLLLQRLSRLSFDDVKGGKITVMETLESRGVGFDGVIVVDFNEEYVPKITTNDLFIDSSVRKRSNLPTRADKEALQKHFYAMLFARAKRVAISYVKNDEQDASRFLAQLPTKSEDSAYYQDILLPSFAKPQLFTPQEELLIELPLTPTKLWALKECSMRYYLSYQKQLFSPDKQRFLGSLIHNAIQEAAKTVPKTYQEYAKAILDYLYANATRQEQLQIAAQWQTKIFAFAKEDFATFFFSFEDEVTKSKPLGSFVLQARADRVVEQKRVIDFKTSKSIGEKERLQALFYAYIWESEEVYIWDLYSVKLKKMEVKGAKEQLEEILKDLPSTIQRAQDERACFFCAYKFACKGEV